MWKGKKKMRAGDEDKKRETKPESMLEQELQGRKQEVRKYPGTGTYNRAGANTRITRTLKVTHTHREGAYVCTCMRK